MQVFFTKLRAHQREFINETIAAVGLVIWVGSQHQQLTILSKRKRLGMSPRLIADIVQVADLVL